MKRVDSFKYVGNMLKEDGWLDMEVNKKGREVFAKATGEIVRSRVLPERYYEGKMMCLYMYPRHGLWEGGRKVKHASEVRFLRNSIG